MKTWDKPGLLLILHSGSPISPGLSLGQTRFVPGTIPGTKGGTESLCEKSLCAFFARYFLGPILGPPFPAHTLLQRKDSNSLAPAVIPPLHGLFRKRGGLVLAYVFLSLPCFPWKIHRNSPQIETYYSCDSQLLCRSILNTAGSFGFEDPSHARRASTQSRKSAIIKMI